MNRVRHDRARLQIEKAVLFCACGSVGYPIKMKPGGFRTVTALFIMILPDKDGADEAGEMPMRYEPNTGAKDFF